MSIYDTEKPRECLKSCLLADHAPHRGPCVGDARHNEGGAFGRRISESLDRQDGWARASGPFVYVDEMFDARTYPPATLEMGGQTFDVRSFRVDLEL